MIFVGLSHHTAPVDVRERLALDEQAKAAFLRKVGDIDCVEEAFVLGTCNRVEVYAVARDERKEADIAQAIRDLLIEQGGVAVAPCLLSLMGDATVEHLFRVASSLESLVVGEPQILGQLKRAVQNAEEAGTVGRALRDATNYAFQLAKRIRTETEIGAGQASVPTAAARLARQIFGDLQGRQVVLVGAGEMAQAAAKVLVHAGASLVIVNRSRDRAERLQANVGGETAPWDELEARLVKTDIVLSSTACPAIILTRPMLERVKRARRGRSLFLIDIAVPRDVDPTINDLEGMYVYDVDDLSKIVEESREAREAAARQAEAILAVELERWVARQVELDMTPVIKELRDRTRRVLEAEMERSFSGKLRGLSPKERAAVQAMIQSATKKLLHEPTMQLRALAGRPDAVAQAECVCAIFGLPPFEGTEDVRATRPEPDRGARDIAKGELNGTGESGPAWMSLACEFAR
jgi:glutamyl-tRNA reductase